MKNAKKILALLLTVVMVLSLGVTALAGGPKPGSDGEITIENATIGKTYAAYKIFDAVLGADGEIAYTYAGTLPTNDYFKQDSAGNITATEAAKGADGKLTDDAITFLGTLKGTTADASTTATTDKVVFSDLAYGYYYITSALGAVVTVDSTMPKVTVIDKNQTPSWDNEDGDDHPGKVIVEGDEKKTVNAVNYGDTVSFDIGVNATNYVGKDQVTYYFIKDTIADGFAFDLTGDPAAFHPTVKVGTKTLVENTDYTVTQSGQDFQIVIKWADVDSADGKITEITSLYAANVEIHVEYNATIDAEGEGVVIAGDGNVNTANFSYKTEEVGGDTPPTTPPTPSPYKEENKKTTTTYVYAIGIQKVDPEGKKLAGAKFSVTTGEPATDIYAIGSNGVYSYADSTATGAVKEFETDANGVLVIKGLEEGTYTVTETEAPKGYNKLTKTFDVTAEIEKTATYTEKITIYYDADGKVVSSEEYDSSEDITVTEKVVPFVVINNAGTELPSTGGIGTQIFYVVGSILLLGAAVLLITKKRMNAKD